MSFFIFFISLLFLIVFYFSKEGRRLDSPVLFFILYYSFNILFPFVVIVSYGGEGAVKNWYNDDNLLLVSVIVFLFVTSWLLGYGVARKSPSRRVLRVLNTLDAPVSCFWSLFIATFFSLVTYFFYSTIEYEARSEIAKSSVGVLVFFLVPFVSFFLGKALASSMARKNIIIFFTSLIVAAFFSYSVFMLGGRGRALGVFLSLILLYAGVKGGYLSTLKTVLTVVFLGLCAIIVIYFEASFGFFNGIVNHKYGRQVDSFENLLRIADHLGFVLIRVDVDRAVYDVISFFLGSEADTTRYYFMHNIVGNYSEYFSYPATKPGELYIQGGLFFLIFVSFFIGYISKKLYSYYLSTSSLDVKVVYCVIFFSLGLVNIKVYFFNSFMMSGLIVFASISALMVLFIARGLLRFLVFHGSVSRSFF